jgi:aspartyl/asparaginyl beta-hydroxylase (cupin superfamily)
MRRMDSEASAPDLEAAWRDGTAALRAGRTDEALACYRRIVEAGRATAAVWVALAMVHKVRAARPDELAALKRALELEPRNLRALILSADHYADAGDPRAAASYYDAVVKVAVAAGQIEPALEVEVGRAQHMREKYSAAYAAHLTAALRAQGLETPEGRRVRRAVELLTGRSELYLSQPRSFYFPELPNIQYAERAAFPWMDRIEAATDEIRDELKRVLAEDAAFSPYVEATPNRPFFDDHGMLGDPSWSAFYLVKGGEVVAENAARCPKTMAAVEDAPLCRIPNRTPSVLFSLLRPGAHIPPHHGFTNARYICHLPLIVPEGCAMRVGSDTREWAEGRACLFDDSIEHEAWNRHLERLRVVLIFDVWRPELSQTERELVSAVLQAVDAYKGA